MDSIVLIVMVGVCLLALLGWEVTLWWPGGGLTTRRPTRRQPRPPATRTKT